MRACLKWIIPHTKIKYWLIKMIFCPYRYINQNDTSRSETHFLRYRSRRILLQSHIFRVKKIFKHRIRKNVKMYVDNMIVKNRMTDTYLMTWWRCFRSWKNSAYASTHPNVFIVWFKFFFWVCHSPQENKYKYEKIYTIIEMYLFQSSKGV